MINIDELTGSKLKKALKLTKARKRYHNKNKTGGNFGMDLQKDGKWYELNGAYDTHGNIYRLAVGEIYDVKARILNPQNASEMEWDRLIPLISRFLVP